jgi:hypothetical protein
MGKALHAHPTLVFCFSAITLTPHFQPMHIAEWGAGVATIGLKWR